MLRLVNLSQSWSSQSNTAEAVVDDSDDEISRGQFSIRRTSGVNAVLQKLRMM